MSHTSNVGDQEFLTQKVILCADLKEKIMLQIYDPFVLENWAVDSCICYILGTFFDVHSCFPKPSNDEVLSSHNQAQTT